jgi:hypothetical protein
MRVFDPVVEEHVSVLEGHDGIREMTKFGALCESVAVAVVDLVAISHTGLHIEMPLRRVLAPPEAITWTAREGSAKLEILRSIARRFGARVPEK